MDCSQEEHYTPEYHSRLVEYGLKDEEFESRRELAEKEVRRLVDKLGVENQERINVKSIYNYRQISQTDLRNIYSIGSLAVASVYIACQENKLPRSLSDMVAATYLCIEREDTVRVDSTTTPNGVKRVCKKSQQRLDQQYLPVDPKKFVERYCSELSLDSKIEEFAKVALGKVEESVKSGRNPNCLAAGAISYGVKTYDADISDREVAQITHCSSRTVRDTRTHIEQSLRGS